MIDQKTCPDCHSIHPMYSNREIVLCPRHASVDALEAENRRLREALKDILPLVGVAIMPEHYEEVVARVKRAADAALASPQPSPSPSEGDARNQAGVDLRPSAGEEGRG